MSRGIYALKIFNMSLKGFHILNKKVGVFIQEKQWVHAVCAFLVVLCLQHTLFVVSSERSLNMYM